jgi:glyoxylase-like metal-dependent hydrolase (beta-lactamase superfamily II)
MKTRLTEAVAENIYRIPVRLPDNPLKELNSYLIKDSRRSLLIDTGFRLPECEEALLTGLEELGEGPGTVDVFLTHLHADHSGLSSIFKTGGGQVFISEIDGDMLSHLPGIGEKWAGEWTEKWAGSRERDVLAGMPADMVDNMYALNPAVLFAPPGGPWCTYVKDGEIFKVGGYSLRCVLTRGHTPGHMCLWEEANGIMFTGDHVLFDITPNITAWPTVADSLGDYLDALRAIREYPVKTSLPGHRKQGDFHARIDELFNHHEARLAEVVAIIGAVPGLTAYEISGRMHWKIRANNWEEFPATQKIFAVGECLSHLDYLLLRGRIEREPDNGVYRYYTKKD